MLQINDKKMRLAGPLVINIYLLIFFYSRLYSSLDAVLVCVIVSSLYSILAWESARFVALAAIEKVPGINQIGKRMRRLILVGLPVTIATTAFNQLFRLWIGFFKALTFMDFFFIEGLNLIITLVVVSFYERQHYLQQWHQLYREAEVTRTINANSQYKVLEDQIKPHFLFNSLNTLQALISTSPMRAEQYVEEMSTVYRYLLRKNRAELSFVYEELEFLHSYLAMLKTRFEDSIIIEIDIVPASYSYLLPPFVLQLLVENSVKHNILSKEQPLKISIFSDSETSIVIQNVLQRKSVVESSEKKGLVNLIERYTILKLENQLKIAEEGGFFKVKIPLLKANIFQPMNPPM